MHENNIQNMYGKSAYGSSSFGGGQTTPNITLQSIVVQSITCTQCDSSPCTTCNVVCQGGTCPSNISVTVTWANSGGVDGIFTPTATTGITTISSIPTNVTVPAGSTATCMFTVTNLSRGLHDICIDSGIIT